MFDNFCGIDYKVFQQNLSLLQSFTFIINIHQFFFSNCPVFFSLSWRGLTGKATRILRHLGVPWLVFPEQWLGTGCRGSVWYTMAPVPWICMDSSCLHIQWHSHHSLIPQFTGGFCVRSMWLSRKLARLTYRSHGLMKTPGRFNVTGRRGRFCWAATMLFTVQVRCFRNVISLVRIGYPPRTVLTFAQKLLVFVITSATWSKCEKLPSLKPA